MDRRERTSPSDRLFQGVRGSRGGCGARSGRGHVWARNSRRWLLVRPRVTIKRSILLPGVSVGDGAYLEDCIVGYGYNVRPGETIRGSALTRRSAGISPLPQATA